MTMQQLAARLDLLERSVAELKALVTASNGKKKESWWISEAGRFANDPLYDEAMRLGREWRESQNPYRKKSKKAAIKKPNRKKAGSSSSEDGGLS